MRDYGKLSPFFWTKGSGRRLRGDAVAQVVASYVSTSPSANMVGIYYVSIATIANDTGHSPNDVQAALERVQVAGYAFYDFEAELVWIPNHARFEVGAGLSAGDKRRPKVLAELAQVEDHAFAARFREIYGYAYGLDHSKAPSERGMQSSPIPTDGAFQESDGSRAGQIRTDQDRAGQDRIDSTSAGAPTVPTKDPGAGRSRRGSRLPDGWTPSEETQAWARSNGVGDPCGKVLDEFRDFWAGVPGARGVKLDWEATFRNRVRQVAGTPRGSRGRADTRQPLRDPASATWLKAGGGGL